MLLKGSTPPPGRSEDKENPDEGRGPAQGGAEGALGGAGTKRTTGCGSQVLSTLVQPLVTLPAADPMADATAEPLHLLSRPSRLL